VVFLPYNFCGSGKIKFHLNSEVDLDTSKIIQDINNLFHASCSLETTQTLSDLFHDTVGNKELFWVLILSGSIYIYI
jgi:hypothetical protein